MNSVRRMRTERSEKHKESLRFLLVWFWQSNIAYIIPIGDKESSSLSPPDVVRCQTMFGSSVIYIAFIVPVCTDEGLVEWYIWFYLLVIHTTSTVFCWTRTSKSVLRIPASCGNFAGTNDLAIFIPDSNVSLSKMTQTCRYNKLCTAQVSYN